MNSIDDSVLLLNGLSVEILDELSYKSELGLSLKKNIHYFSKESVIREMGKMSDGKKHDDGYRGVHLYYQKDNFHYPIEIQFKTFYDRQINNWLHDYLYKKNYPDEIGRLLRMEYEAGKIRSDKDFREALECAIS